MTRLSISSSTVVNESRWNGEGYNQVASAEVSQSFWRIRLRAEINVLN
jgi:hypothetical protein